MFVYNVIGDLESIDHLCIGRIGLIHKLSLDARKLKWSVQVNILQINCKQNISSLLVDTTVTIHMKYQTYLVY